jgi:hypothetical protein
MRAIEAITGHYKQNQKQFIDVPEWGSDGAPLRIYWNLLTVEQRNKLNATGKNDVDGLVMLALDEQGNRMFDLADKPLLLTQADAGIVSRIVAAMLSSTWLTKESVDDAAKN